MKTKTMIAYGVFLILAGVTGYLSNPEKAATALLSGGFFGCLAILTGVLFHKNWRFAHGLALGILAMLIVVFSWRSTVSWMAVMNGATEKIFAAALITSMLLASLISLGFVIRKPAPKI